MICLFFAAELTFCALEKAIDIGTVPPDAHGAQYQRPYGMRPEGLKDDHQRAVENEQHNAAQRHIASDENHGDVHKDGNPAPERESEREHSRSAGNPLAALEAKVQRPVMTADGHEPCDHGAAAAGNEPAKDDGDDGFAAIADEGDNAGAQAVHTVHIGGAGIIAAVVAHIAAKIAAPLNV